MHHTRSVIKPTPHLLLQRFEYPYHAPSILGSDLCLQVLLGSLAQAEGFPSGADLLSAHLASILPLLSPAATWHTQARDLQVYCLIKSLTSAASNPPDAER